MSGRTGWFVEAPRRPRCGSAILTDGDATWCSFVGGRSQAPCTWGLGDLDRGSREADAAAHREPIRLGGWMGDV